ncbi:MSEP-CTERM sorting domain-containing protein [Hymenobacter sp. H14-R3]|uniref:MSEP-CTERM sorting domain-containing protein n=1 Tax=Hymenobacter sp. H14-R3 TaxID=3046308 RepID=UPI0024BB8AB9|nr:MSEP-CTERM sorting domain-containing protein [Hymenobacter sp. H14-R3]MDJ0364074.1 MSEP-CTERM sorting domain-containing protein [Hymenobacter sp. H14-R3]
MHNLLNAKWLLLLNTLPLLLLAALGYGEFSVIETLLPAASVAVWQQLALGLAALGGATLLHAAWQWRRGLPLSSRYAGAALVAYVAYLAWYTSSSEVVLPRDIPRWMVPTDLLVYVWTFLMPTLAHALLVLVVRSVPAARPQSVLPSLGLAVAIPVGGWLVLGLLSTLLGSWVNGSWLDGPLLLAGLVVGPLTFLFFLVRAAYLFSLRRDDEFTIIWKVLITLVLPLLGLLVNTGMLLGGVGKQSGIFGNFNTPWFYGLAVLNGVLLCLPAPARPAGRLALLGARSVLLGYTCYFFLVFLPFLPLSLLAVIAIGTGFLMLAPLVLLVVHVRLLAEDVVAVRPHFARWVPRAVLVGGATVLPLLLTADYYHARRTLHAALAYVYTPDYTKSYDLDAATLARTLATVRQHKDHGRDLFMGSQQPFLSTYFNWLVLDNLLLSESKLTTLESVFGLGDTRVDAWNSGMFTATAAAPAPAALRHLTARSTYDARQQAWVSWVDVEVGNPNPAQPAGEYRTTFALPAGCWVSDYYLDIDGRREPGILAEKKAADWVYTQIVHQNDRRDPGLLAYAGPDQLRLQVYPVVENTPRRTGVQLTHKEPVSLLIDGQTVQLGRPGLVAPTPAPVATPGGAVVYLSAAAKQQLPLVQRRPYYHFLLDVSAAAQVRKEAYKQWVTTFMAQYPSAAPARFTLVNTYATPVPAGADWRQQLDGFANAGGCYLTGAVRRTLAEAQLHPAASYPVLVVVTDSLTGTVLDPDFADLAAAYPEGDTFLVLGEGKILEAQGQVTGHSLRAASGEVVQNAVNQAEAKPGVRAWPTAAQPRAYLPNDGRASVVLSQPAAALAVPTAAASRWQTGLLLRGYAQWQALHPAAADAQHLAFIQASFRSRLLTPLTAFLALENQAQKQALYRKQAQTLAANASLDTQEAAPPSTATAVPLDDYAPWLLLLGVGLGSWWLRRPRLAG